MKKKLTPKSCGHKTVPLDHFQSYRIILRSVDTIQYPHTNQYPTLYIYIIKQQKIIASNNFCPRHLLINIRLSIDPGNWQRVFQAPTHGSCWGIVIPLWQVHIAMKHCPLLDMTRMMVYLLNMVPIATLPEGITTY